MIMKKGVARAGDVVSGICYHPSHVDDKGNPSPVSAKGIIGMGMPDVFTNGKTTACHTVRVRTPLGHYGEITEFSSSVFVTFWSSWGVARVGDSVGGVGDFVGTIDANSSNVYCGG